MAVPEALAEFTAIAGVRTASQLHRPSPDTTGPAQTLPVLPALGVLLPGSGLRRGSTVSVLGSTSLVLVLLAEATQAGSWAAVAGMPDLGLVAAAELGVDLDRIALVPDPGAELVAVLSALVDGFDLVVLGPTVCRGAQPQLARRLAGRLRTRGAVLLAAGPWPGADVELCLSGHTWRGTTADGHGYLQGCDVVATSRGRGAATRPHSIPLQLPGAGGVVAAGEPLARRPLVEVAG
ncbi:hypothetical protein SAMN04489727_1988 [Amycolatopsis tolypomycina]|uniref:Recombinase A n=1 Tax=Amycolatopsis tolypomycina TaxID=208445 RepID=A0A1H4JKE8_9PSEU|nr:hypothetical protein [Amycolatopsis tolypomycina]SEB46800.1 hypothetical protein SAMN04489727_1988 [Amycolatopsis tolypomycina]